MYSFIRNRYHDRRDPNRVVIAKCKNCGRTGWNCICIECIKCMKRSALPCKCGCIQIECKRWWCGAKWHYCANNGAVFVDLHGKKGGECGCKREKKIEIAPGVSLWNDQAKLYLMQDKPDHCIGKSWKQWGILQYKLDKVVYCEYCSNECLEGSDKYKGEFKFEKYVDCQCKKCAAQRSVVF